MCGLDKHWMVERQRAMICLLACTALVAGWLLGGVMPANAQQAVPVRLPAPEPASRVAADGPGGPSYSLPPPVAISPYDPGEFGLDDLVAIAEQQSPQLAQAAAEIEMARGRTRQAGLYPNPVAEGGAMQLGGSESQYYAQLSQEIVTKHKLRLSQAAASQEITQAELRFVRARYDLLTRVRQGYIAVLAADRRIVVLRQLVDLARKSSVAADRLFQAGEGARPDALLFEIELEKAEVALENAHVAAAGARRQLAAVIGQRDLDLFRVSGSLTASLDRLAEQIAIDGYVPMNADVLIAEVEVERTRLLARRAEVEPFPNVTVTGGYMNQLEGVENMGILMFALPIPLWDKNQGNIQAARAEVGRAMQGVGQSQNNIARQMAESIARFRSAHQRVLRYEQRIMPKAAEGVRLIQQGFQAQQFDFQRLLQAQRSLVEADLGYVEALEARWNAAAELAGLAQLEAFP